MNYELAKQLKDAGFPGSEKWWDYGDFFAPTIGDGPEVVPTLEELIEACVSLNHDWNFYLEYNRSQTWWAKFTDFGALITERSGHTPTEAVASLWLTLNKK